MPGVFCIAHFVGMVFRVLNVLCGLVVPEPLCLDFSHIVHLVGILLKPLAVSCGVCWQLGRLHDYAFALLCS